MKNTWKRSTTQLETNLVFSDFVSAFAFLTEVAIWAEKLNHHPTWTNTYNRVHIVLTTHDEGNTVTKKDEELAEKITQIAKKYIKDAA
jgi:4a-hydroxytetrahydrobiopterin dehydratase